MKLDKMKLVVKRKSKSKKNFFTILIILLVISFFIGIICYNIHQKNQEDIKNNILLKEIKNNYASLVRTNKETKLYKYIDKEYVESGELGENVELSIGKLEISFDTLYFPITSLDEEYYVYYKDVEKIDNLTLKDTRYKNYIPFNENVVTNEITSFYKDDKLVFKFNKSYNLPIYIKDSNKYYVEYNDELLYVLKDDIKELIENKNSDKVKATEIATIVYHFFYDPEIGEECNQEICHSKQQFTSHLTYLKDNNFFTLKMNEFEEWIDGKINLPKKSVVITIDDGEKSKIGIKLLEQFQLNGTVFLITAYYPNFTSEYVESHSHSNNLHNQGACPTGQGGAIQCLDKSTLLDDLKQSREALNGSTVFCYPFYEYNDYSISVLKEAGFTMAFAGPYAQGKARMHVGDDKYQIPRFTMGGQSTVRYFASLINY